MHESAFCVYDRRRNPPVFGLNVNFRGGATLQKHCTSAVNFAGIGPIRVAICTKFGIFSTFRKIYANFRSFQPKKAVSDSEYVNKGNSTNLSWQTGRVQIQTGRVPFCTRQHPVPSAGTRRHSADTSSGFEDVKKPPEGGSVHFSRILTISGRPWWIAGKARVTYLQIFWNQNAWEIACVFRNSVKIPVFLACPIFGGVSPRVFRRNWRPKVGNRPPGGCVGVADRGPKNGNKRVNLMCGVPQLPPGGRQPTQI